MPNEQALPVEEPATQRPRVQSAARAIGILLAIAQSESGLSTREISERVGIGRQATYHLLHTLQATGMLTRDDRNRYLLGLRVGTLAEAFSRQLAPSEHLAPLVRALAQETGETAYASGWWHGEIMTLSFSRGTNPVQAAEVPQGYVGDAHARASGKLLLATATATVRDEYLAAHPLRRLTPNTISSRRRLDTEFAAIRERGYSVDDEEFAPGLLCMAVPFDGGYSPFVVAVSGPRERMLERRDTYLDALRRITEPGANSRGAA
ncbi:IclR family transcriptional regulator [Conexibacter stalactiti]|uniref:IclR family transcriptional regulator n=1 Tax=Conexibacter stalactiti TaxID=1940611 RepID=A0ABU4HLC7_9ACTN|nr:IclR family transcriptional regulator [Conexibacter stalactiti]MDW5594099.1 IclR family transcriptional regulator [Conexibacter stalactiti]MEC5034741.1 IclR family transcriptional regulator [Conexibacter stalactiti]